jgi:mRNA-degrading endonuclease RelE of RelBE toxin-antitoxin system
MVRYRIALTKTASEALQRIEKRAQKQIINTLRDLEESPLNRGAALLGELQGYLDLRAAGQRYRIIVIIPLSSAAHNFVSPASELYPEAPPTWLRARIHDSESSSRSRHERTTARMFSIHNVTRGMWSEPGSITEPGYRVTVPKGVRRSQSDSTLVISGQ